MQTSFHYHGENCIALGWWGIVGVVHRAYSLFKSGDFINCLENSFWTPVELENSIVVEGRECRFGRDLKEWSTMMWSLLRTTRAKNPLRTL